ncbi:MAG: hypothetical protein U5K84_07900 [Alkalibacterium sp.]|nr:hypothetical protein [Alkalibacterium sp.]
MKKTLFNHLFIYILSGSILIISLFSFLMFQITENRFGDYLSDRYAAERETVIETIEAAYTGSEQWDREVLSSVIQNAMHSHMLVRVVDTDGDEIISHTTPMGQHMQRMQRVSVVPSDNWADEEVELFSEGDYIGSAFITFPGFQEYTAEETEFLDDLTSADRLDGLISIIVAGIMAI